MYGNMPRVWSKDLNPRQKMRYTINALTRMRFCDINGKLDFSYSGPPGTQPKRLMPWFDHPRRKTADTQIVCGHWAALGVVQRKDVAALDSGCVWGRRLTAIPLKKRGSKNGKKRFRVKCRV